MMTDTLTTQKVSFRTKVTDFVDNNPTECIALVCMMFFLSLIIIMAVEIENQKSISRGIFIEAKFDKIMSGELSIEDYKVMKEIDFKPDNVMEQLNTFKKKF